ncbi:MAG: peptidylprolyl isomerase [Cyclobacteriaceae bacterium]|nr:peptidylprolyl isomerase [Cyclobacteriaceae bacterium]MCH8516936.1 peptidylprolyl isomerase [Cyclobacteriaceae bacterium]
MILRYLTSLFLVWVLSFAFATQNSWAQEEDEPQLEVEEKKPAKPRDKSRDIVADKIIVKVDNYIVLKSELERTYLDFRAQGRRGVTRCEILENLLINKLMVAHAEIDSVLVSDIEVLQNLEQRMGMMLQQIGGEEKLQEIYGKSVNQFKDELEDQVREQLIADKMQREITRGLSVTPAEVKRFFDKIPRDSLPFFSTEVSVAQIVKKPEVSREQKQKSIDLLNDIRRRVLDGEDFGTFARKYSKDPGSAANGGELPGFYNRGELAPEYEATSLSLKPGEIGAPVETQFGIHLIQLLERRGNQFRTRHILVTPEPTEADVKKAERYLDSLRTEIENKNISFTKAAKEYSTERETSGSGGFFTDGDGSIFVSTEELDPVIFFTIDTLEVGSITKPIRYKERDGTEHVRILWYKDRIKPHRANLKQDYQKIQIAALAEKRNRRLEEWFEQAQKGVYINIDPEYQDCNLLNQ